MLGLQRPGFRQRLALASPQSRNVVDHTGPAGAAAREAARRQAAEDQAYQLWYDDRRQIEELIKALAGPRAVIPEPPPE